jgi:peptidoglycan/LPS O-acetylase OafA/YrhL
MTHRKDIDGLRAIAVLSVVFFHAFPKLLPGGFIGVDVFFVLSGFLISSILFNQIENGSIRWGNFYLKRMKRIFPALLLVLFAAILMGYFLLLPLEYENLGKHIWGSSSFINNFVLWREAGYFDKASALKPLLHLWSLGIEEQFYLIWPAFIYCIWRFRFNPVIALVIFSIISFSINLAWVHHHNVRAFYFPAARFWELAVGGIVAYTHASQIKRNDSRMLVISNIASCIALAALFIGIFYFSEQLAYPGWAAILPTLCTVIFLLTPDAWINRRLLSVQVMTFIGLISYPLYLWHWELLSFSRIVYSDIVPLTVTTLLLSLSFLLAYLTYQWVEKPIRFSATAEKKPRYIASGLCGGLLIVGVLGFMIQYFNGFSNRSPIRQYARMLNDAQTFDSFREQTIPCELSSKNKDLKNITSCLQNKKGQPQNVVWGDSHAEHLFPGILKADKKNNWLLLEQTGCPPLLKVASYWKGSNDKCQKANDIILKSIIDTPSINTVVLASLGSFYISEESYAAASQGDFSASKHYLEEVNIKKSKQDVFYDGLNRTIDALEKAGKKVILFQDTPEFPFMPERCMNRPLAPKKSCLMTRSEFVARQKEYAMILEQIKTQRKTLLFNPIDIVCDIEHCALIKNNYFMYRDSHHLSVLGSELIAEQFIPWVNLGGT